MAIEVKVPMLPESVADATIAQWHKKPGDSVKRDENIVDLETDKVMLEVPAPEDGVIAEILQKEGAKVTANTVIAVIKPGAAAEKEAAPKKEEKSAKEEPAAEKKETKTAAATAADLSGLSPSVRRLIAEKDIDVNQIKGSGKDGRITKEDVEKFISQGGSSAQKAAQSTMGLSDRGVMGIAQGQRTEQRVPMSRLRARIAERLLEVKQSTAMLTTFNEINMQPIMDLRARYKDNFEKQFDVRLGFMSFFVKASVEALKRYPLVNASIDGNDIVYHGYYDVGIAVSAPRGLVVPILRNVDQLSMADIEKEIREYAIKARDNKLTMEEMTGGTFTITNGGVFGSMMSTPIINPPQSAILGMHNIVKRPVVEGDEIVIRPMMYVALSYDHRIIDGKDSVGFLVTIKELLEDPARLILGI
jgi:2-oxoglutarate dehydrogenase E2 component (dihydrolipoamide succinyltransferase)